MANKYFSIHLRTLPVHPLAQALYAEQQIARIATTLARLRVDDFSPENQMRVLSYEMRISVLTSVCTELRLMVRS